jgi:hypothetical protein
MLLGRHPKWAAIGSVALKALPVLNLFECFALKFEPAIALVPI